MPKRRRKTRVTKGWLSAQPVEVQALIARLIEDLRPHFAGETIEVAMPQDLTWEDRAKRRERVRLAVANGESPQAIAQREGLTAGAVRKMGARHSR